MYTSHQLKLHRTISSPNPEATYPNILKKPSITSNESPSLKSKLSIKSCPEDDDDEKMQSLNNNLDDLFTKINQLAEEVTTEQKTKQPILEVKTQAQTDRPKAVYIDKRVHKKSFEVVHVPKIK